MTLSYKVDGSSGEHTIKVSFDPPLVGYDEVKPRLLSMKLDAEESLGMVPRPQIKTFEFPKSVYTQTGPLMVFLIYTSFGTVGIQWLRDLVGGWKTLTYVWWFVFVVHSLESFYTLFLCRRYRTGLVNGVCCFKNNPCINLTCLQFKFWLATLAVGAPIWISMRRRVQRMRIESINKVH